jgi:molecular chaperone DnaK (HSP70)
MTEKNIIKTILKNSIRDKHEPNLHEKINAEVITTPVNFEEAKVQTDLPLIDSHLESIKSPYGL